MNRLATTLLAAATAATLSAPAAAADEGAPSYVALMKLPPAERFQRMEKLPEAEREAFFARLSPDRKAALLVDPADCGLVARTKRLGFANSRPEDGFVLETAQDVGKSLASGALDRMLPGLGSALSTGAQINEINKLRDYVDVCDLAPADRTALLEPSDEPPPPPKKEDSLFDKASRFFSR